MCVNLGGLEGEETGGGRLKRVRVSGRTRKEEDKGVSGGKNKGGSVDFWHVLVNSGRFYPNQYDVVS